MSTGILAGLFISAFTSATLLPGSSEAVLVAIMAAGDVSTALAIGVATLGNTLGSCVNWAMGRYASQFRQRRWFPVSPEKFEQYSRWYNKWGLWSLLASWVPIIGDPLTVLAGVARTPFWVFLPVVLVAKFVRYLIVAGVFGVFF